MTRKEKISIGFVTTIRCFNTFDRFHHKRDTLEIDRIQRAVMDSDCEPLFIPELAR